MQNQINGKTVDFLYAISDLWQNELGNLLSFLFLKIVFVIRKGLCPHGHD